jgi:hypothetical protein
MLSRFAARLVTGPIAFFLAWCIDVLGLLRQQLSQRKKR